jgi:hypothetical protein
MVIGFGDRSNADMQGEYRLLLSPTDERVWRIQLERAIYWQFNDVSCLAQVVSGEEDV